MPSERDRAIRERAYARWVESGREEGRSEEHWLRAEKEWDGEAGRTGQPGEEAGRKRRKAEAGAPKRSSAAVEAGSAPAKAAGRALKAKAAVSGAPAR